jgi:hypothetical protein
MNQREVDIFFWDAVGDMWADMAAKPIIMDGQPCHDPKVIRLAHKMIDHGSVSEKTLDYVQRHFAADWNLSQADLGILIGREVLYFETLNAVIGNPPNNYQ